MLVIKVAPKSKDSLIKMMQELNDKKFRYFADITKQQIVNFDDTKSIPFFHIVCKYCEIYALMNENFQDYPFVDYDMNSIFTHLVADLCTLEATDSNKAKSILEEFYSFLKKKDSDYTSEAKAKPSSTSDTAQNEATSPAKTDGDQTETVHPEVKEVQPETAPAEVKDVQPEDAPIEVVEVQLEDAPDEIDDIPEQPILRAEPKVEVTTASDKKDILDIIPEDIKNSMTKNELILLPYVYKGIAAVNSLRKANEVEKADTFLNTINFPNKSYILCMIVVLDTISTVTFNNIFATPFYKVNQLTDDPKNSFKIRCQTREDFRKWATENCPDAIESNHLLSFADILKIYKRFAE